MTADSSKASNSKRKRVLIVDDHPVVREGLVQQINREHDLEVCAEASIPLPMKSFDGMGFREGTDEASRTGGVASSSKGDSEIDGATLIEETDFDVSARLCADSFLLLRAEDGGAGSIFLSRTAAGGDMRTSPAISSNVGALPAGLLVSISGATVRGVTGGSGGGATGTSWSDTATGAIGGGTLLVERAGSEV